MKVILLCENHDAVIVQTINDVHISEHDQYMYFTWNTSVNECLVWMDEDL